MAKQQLPTSYAYQAQAQAEADCSCAISILSVMRNNRAVVETRVTKVDSLQAVTSDDWLDSGTGCIADSPPCGRLAASLIG